MEKGEIIARMYELTEGVSNMLVIEKQMVNFVVLNIQYPNVKI